MAKLSDFANAFEDTPEPQGVSLNDFKNAFEDDENETINRNTSNSTIDAETDALSPEEIGTHLAKVGKSVTQGLVSIADLPIVLGNLGIMGANKALGTTIPEVPEEYMPSEVVGQGIDRLSGGRTVIDPNSTEGTIHAGIRGGAGMFGGGAIGKGLGVLGRFLGSTTKTGVAAGTASGMAVNEAQRAGVGTGGQLAAGLGAGAATGSIPGLIRGASNLPTKTLGLGPKQFKKEAFEAGQNIGVDVPANALTDSRAMKVAHTVGNRTPIIGTALYKQAVETSQKFTKKVDTLLERIGPKQDEAGLIGKEISDKYTAARNALQETEITHPNNTLKSVEEIAKKAGTTLIKSTETKELMKDLNDMHQLLSSGQVGAGAIPTTVETLVGTKRNLNKIIKWNKDHDVRSLLKDVQKAVVQDIEEYGTKHNPEFLKKFRQADKFFGEVMNRENADKIIGKTIDPVSETISYKKFLNSLQQESNQKVLKKALGENGMKDLKNFVKFSQGMVKAGVDIAGSGTTQLQNYQKVVGYLGTTLAGVVIGTVGPSAILPVAGVAAGGYLAKRLLTNKEVLKKAANLAKNPSEKGMKALDNVLKRHIGMSLQTTIKVLKEQQND